ncbi:hypothetical protein MCEJIRE27_00234 [Candidatus Nanopelagicaceae bacterium]
MSFSDEDKEALGEDLDELKATLNAIKDKATSIDKNLGSLLTMAWVAIVISVVGALVIVAAISIGA